MGKLLVIAAKRHNGAIIAKPAQSADSRTSTEFTMDSIEWVTTICTDEPKINGRLPFRHDSVNHSHRELMWGNVHTNNIESLGCCSIVHG